VCIKPDNTQDLHLPGDCMDEQKLNTGSRAQAAAAYTFSNMLNITGGTA